MTPKTQQGEAPAGLYGRPGVRAVDGATLATVDCASRRDDSDCQFPNCGCRKLSAPSPSPAVREAFETAMRQTWKMIDPLHPPPAGSYYRGEHEGICAALKTLRENFDRALALSAPSVPPVGEADCVEAERLACIFNNHMEDSHDIKDAAALLLRIAALRASAPVQAVPPVEAPSEFETRADGKLVRRDRWEWGIRRIVALLWGNRQEFEIDEVVEAVRARIPEPFNDGDDEGLAQAVQRQYGASAPVQEGREPVAGAADMPASKTERELRRLLCAVYAGPAAYMDDGEASDSRRLPHIDFMRMTPAEIRAAMQRRGLADIAAAQPPGEQP